MGPHRYILLVLYNTFRIINYRIILINSNSNNSMYYTSILLVVVSRVNDGTSFYWNQLVSGLVR